VNANNPAVVLDSSAVLAYLNNEAGAERVVVLLRAAKAGEARLLLCEINLGEILYTVERRRGLAAAQQVLALLESLPFQQVEANRALVLDAAHIKATHPISYADAFVCALAMRENAVILTSDPEFNAVQGLVRLEWLPARA